MKIFLVVAFLFQVLSSSYCHAVYLLSKDDKPLEFEEWRTTQENIHRQVWLEGKSLAELTLPQGVVSSFVPDSLMQAFALNKLYTVLCNNVQKQLAGINIDEGYIEVKEIPFRFIDSEKEYDDSCKKNPKINKKFTAAFEKEREKILKKYFLKRSLDEGFIDIINQTPPSSDSDNEDLEKSSWKTPLLEDARAFFLDQNFSLNEFTKCRLIAQHTLENLFFKEYQAYIINDGWSDILNTFYSPINITDEKSPHFINVSHGAFSYINNNRFLEDHDNLCKTIIFEAQCEKDNTIALLRGDGSRDSRATNEHHNQLGTLASISLGRGYYSGIFRDADASIAYRSSKHKYFKGLVASKQIFSDLIIIPPLSWYINLGLGGELWHPRTTVAIQTPLEKRNTEQQINGLNLLGPIDKLGILIKKGDTQSHFKKVLEMLENSEILKENSDL